MSKNRILNLIFLLVVLAALAYAIFTKNLMGIVLMSFWSIFYLCALVYSLIYVKVKQKRLKQEVKEWFEQFSKEE